LWVNREINAADAFVAAWLPGSEGAGIADVLLRNAQGETAHDFKGKLGYSWPRTATQFANNVGQKDYSPQFAFGYGLTYADKGDVAPLPEVSGLSGEQKVAGVYFARGRAAPGTSLRLENAQGHATKVTTLPAAVQDNSLRVAAVDYKAQEDALRFSWAGTGKASAFLSADAPFDVLRESNGDVMLVLTLRPETVPQAEVNLGVACGDGCAAALPLRDALAALPKEQWTTLGVPLKCFGAAGADLTKLSQPMRLETAGALQFSLSRVTLGAIHEATDVFECPQP
jgi:beta-glucosidase